MNGRKLSWDIGTAYDLFISLHVLHNPSKFGLRGSWAAGVRSRLPVQERKTLEQADILVWIPSQWVLELPQPKDCLAVFTALEEIPARERISRLAFHYDLSPDMRALLLNIAERGAWDNSDQEYLKAYYKKSGWSTRSGTIESTLEAWASADETGEQYLDALKAYYEVFFAEEEKRILPDLKYALEQAHELAEKLDLSELIEELSQGVRFDTQDQTPGQDFVLVPSFWSTPLIIFNRLSETSRFLIFGARPADASLVPGEMVPDKMLQALKSLADPTRLRILRYLGKGPHTPTQLARLLRLRAPTVVHHLNELRLAGLVQLTVVVPEKKSERRYAARTESIPRLFESLQAFLAQQDLHPKEPNEK